MVFFIRGKGLDFSSLFFCPVFSAGQKKDARRKAGIFFVRQVSFSLGLSL
jgi:hypothetical protein